MVVKYAHPSLYRKCRVCGKLSFGFQCKGCYVIKSTHGRVYQAIKKKHLRRHYGLPV